MKDNKKLACSWCGRFVSFRDLESGKAYTYMSTPDSHYSQEDWETVCRKCKEIADK